MIDVPHTGAVVMQRAIWTSSCNVGRFWKSSWRRAPGRPLLGGYE